MRWGLSCMMAALRRAGFRLRYDYVNAHGNIDAARATKLNSQQGRVVGNGASRLTMSSTEVLIGHLLGAAGG